MNLLSIENEWQYAFGSALPAGFLCRNELQDRWLRIHSLPGSKRYAETGAERSEILARHNLIADYTLGGNSDCALFFTQFGSNKSWSSSEGGALGERIPEHIMSFHEGEEQFEFFALNITWRSGAFDELLLAVAQERVGPILFANIENRSIYAPYDGGADLFFPSSAAAELAKQHFAYWLSKREDGM